MSRLERPRATRPRISVSRGVRASSRRPFLCACPATARTASTQSASRAPWVTRSFSRAAVAYQSALEPRPYRETHTAEAAAARLQDRVSRGALDADSVESVLAVAGHARRTARRDDALTPRETEILGLVARGLSNRDIATRLVLSEKTVRNHVERTYAKIGATNRVGASLYALERGLVAPDRG